MIMQAALPYHFRLRTLTGLSPAILGKSGEIYYIGGTDVLPSPLSPRRRRRPLPLCRTRKTRRPGPV